MRMFDLTLPVSPEVKALNERSLMPSNDMRVYQSSLGDMLTVHLTSPVLGFTAGGTRLNRDQVGALHTLLGEWLGESSKEEIDLTCFSEWLDVAVERIVAAREAAAREAVLAEVEALAREFIPPYNCELRYDGTEDPSIAAWVEDRSEVVDRLHALVARLRADA